MWAKLSDEGADPPAMRVRVLAWRSMPSHAEPAAGAVMSLSARAAMMLVGEAAALPSNNVSLVMSHSRETSCETPPPTDAPYKISWGASPLKLGPVAPVEPGPPDPPAGPVAPVVPALVAPVAPSVPAGPVAPVVPAPAGP